ncbi:MAG: hypothetical protein WDM91_23630 [Rhizomicrobium sp.]
MTSIPPLGQAPRTVMAARSTPSAAPPAGPFGALVGGRGALTPGLRSALPLVVPVGDLQTFDNAQAGTDAPDHGFQFDELGMFGQFGAQALAAEAVALPGDTIATPANAGSFAPGAAAAEAEAAPGVQAVTGVPYASLPTAPASLQDGAVGMAEAPAFVAVGAASVDTSGSSALPLALSEEIALPFAAGDEGADTMFASAGVPGRLPLRAPAAGGAANPLNLVVADENGALSIAVRSESGGDYARLRRLVEAAASEFGLEVSDFRLNGSAAEQTHIPGGSRDGRTR